MYLVDEIFCKNGVWEKINIIYGVVVGKIFGIFGYCEFLEKVVVKKNIDVCYYYNFKVINFNVKEVIFIVNGKMEVILFYDIIYVIFFMFVLDFIKNSFLVVEVGGWVDVDKFIL